MSDTPQTDEIGIDHLSSTEREYKLRNRTRELESEVTRLRDALQMVSNYVGPDFRVPVEIAREALAVAKLEMV